MSRCHSIILAEIQNLPPCHSHPTTCHPANQQVGQLLYSMSQLRPTMKCILFPQTSRPRDQLRDLQSSEQRSGGTYTAQNHTRDEPTGVTPYGTASLRSSLGMSTSSGASQENLGKVAQIVLSHLPRTSWSSRFSIPSNTTRLAGLRPEINLAGVLKDLAALKNRPSNPVLQYW